MQGRIVQVSISDGGMPKRAVESASLTATGLEGDRQKNLKVHGGPDRAVCLYSVEDYAWLNTLGIALGPGDIGDNLTLQGIDLQQLKPGDRLTIGGEDRVPDSNHPGA